MSSPWPQPTRSALDPTLSSSPVAFAATAPLIVGCWQLDQRSWRSLSEKDIALALDRYLAQGVTCFDTADIYGRSEALLGQLLKGEPCQIFTKAVFFGGVPTPQQVRLKIENSLHNLQRDTLDLVQVHWHDPQLDFTSTFATLVSLLEAGKIRRLGVTNFNTSMLKTALALAPIQTHQVQYSLIDRRLEDTMRNLCQTHGITLLAYGPLAGGLLSDRFRGVSKPQLPPDHAQSFYYSSMIEAHGGWARLQAFLDGIAPIAQRYGKSIATLALNWVWQQQGVGGVISGLTLDRRQIEQTVTAQTLQLTPEDLDALSTLSAQLFEQPGDVYSYERQ